MIIQNTKRFRKGDPQRAWFPLFVLLVTYSHPWRMWGFLCKTALSCSVNLLFSSYLVKAWAAEEFACWWVTYMITEFASVNDEFGSWPRSSNSAWKSVLSRVGLVSPTFWKNPCFSHKSHPPHVLQRKGRIRPFRRGVLFACWVRSYVSLFL